MKAKIFSLLLFSFFLLLEDESHARIAATKTDISIYQAMNTSFFCMATLDNIPFAKSHGIAASTYAQALEGRHEGRVRSLGRKKLTKKEMALLQLFIQHQNQILSRQEVARALN